MKSLVGLALSLGLLACHGRAQSTGDEVFAMGVGPVLLANEGPLTPNDYQRPLFSDSGFVVRGNTTTGEEFHIWIFWYRQLGKEEYVVNGDVMQVALLRGNFSEEDLSHMNNVPFINKGQNLEDYRHPGTMRVSQTDNRVTWQFEGISSTAKQGEWTVKGSYGDVDVDLHIRPRGNMFYHAGDFADLSGCENETTSTNYDCIGVAGGIVHVSASGTITANGTELEIDQAQGVHERILMASNVPPRLEVGLGRGSFWLHGWGERFSWFTFTSEQGPYAVGMVNIGNETHVSGGNLNVTIEARDHWLDPETDQINPTGWHTTAQFENGVLEADVQAFGRVYYYWLRNGGLLVVNQMTAYMVMRYTPHGGQPIMDKGGAFMEYMKTFYEQP
ncbi:hypothetical protein BJX99DRAFT_260416 [Aspergillus californicus]